MRKKTLVALSLLSISALVGAFSTTTYALFASAVRISQGVGSQGRIKKSIYLCPNIWEVDNPLYILHVYNSDTDDYDDLLPSKTVSITVSDIAMNCKVFEFDDVTYNSFVFERKNPSDGSTWNQTDDIEEWDGTNNVYRIIDWDNNLGRHNSGYDAYPY